ncbi:MAG: Ig-like domain-containing protein [Deltaproteobacteria bacterium]|nr:Ig-like domain-containing protein [Deltaproteobacteria bacterium]
MRLSSARVVVVGWLALFAAGCGDNGEVESDAAMTDSRVPDASSPDSSADASVVEVSAAMSTVTVDRATGVVANGTEQSTVTVTVRDAAGNALTGVNVTLAVTGTGNTVSTPAPTNASGVTTATLASTRAEVKTITATAGGVTLTQMPTVAFVAGAPSAAMSTVSASPATVIANGTATSTITVTVRDSNGNPIAGRPVGLAATGTSNTLVQPGMTSAAGVTTGTLASTAAGIKVVTATVAPGAGQLVITQTASVTFTVGAISPSISTVIAAPTSVSADGVAVSTVTITVRDSGGNPVPGIPVGLTATGTGNVLVQPAVTNASGVTTGTIASTRAETKTVTATADPTGAAVAITQQPTVTFVPGAVSPLSTIAATPLTLAADGTAVSTITVTVRDASGNPIPGRTVALAATGTGNTLTQPAGVTGATGVATGTLASTVAATKIVTAIVDPGAGQVALTGMATIVFQAGSASAATTTLTVSPPSATANGTSVVTVTVTVRDGSGNPLGGRAVALSATGSGNTLTQPVGVTGADGVATGTIASTVAEAKTVSAVIDPAGANIAVTQTATATFTSGSPTTTNSTVVVSPATGVTADGVTSATITVTVIDGAGNPVPGQTVSLAATGTGNTVTQPALATSASGVTTGSIRSTVAEVKTITATIDPTGTPAVITQQPTVAFVAGAPSATTTTLAVAPQSGITADGVATAGVTVTVRDSGGNPVAGATVALAATGTGNVVSAPGLSDVNGIYLGSVASTVAGTKTISATIDPAGTPVAVTQTGSASFSPGAASATVSTLVAAPTAGLAANGVAQSTVTVTLLDAQGNPVPGQTVELGATGSFNTLSAPGVTDAAGVYTGSIRSTRAETKVVSATVNPGAGQVVLGQTASVDFLPGSISAATSTLRATPDVNITADDVQTSTITVVVLDAVQNPLSGVTVTLAATGTGNTLSAPGPTDVNGIYTGFIRSTRAELKTVSAMANAINLAQTVTVDFVAGPVDAANSTLTATPTTRTAGQSSTVTVTLYDAFMNPVPGAAVVLSATGTSTSLVQPAATDAAGVTTGSLSATAPGAKVVSATGNGTPVTQTATVQYDPGAVDGAMSTVVASPGTPFADNSATATITVTVLDGFGNPIPSVLVALAATGSGNTLSAPANTDLSGVYTGTIRSSDLGTKTVSASAGGSPITQTADVTFGPGPISAANSALTLDRWANLRADGTDVSTVTITARDTANRVIPGATAVVTLTGGTAGNILTQPAAPTDGAGVATASIASTIAGTPIVGVNLTYGGSTVTASQRQTVGYACAAPRSCNTLFLSGVTTSGQYTIDPDGQGGVPAFSVWCDMTSPLGGWTVLYGSDGGDAQMPIVSDTPAGGNPLLFERYNTTRAQKIAFSTMAHGAGYMANVTRAGGHLTFVTTPPVPLFGASLATPGSEFHAPISIFEPIPGIFLDSGFVGWSNFNIAGGGDFNISGTDGLTSCPTLTMSGVDHHSTSYAHLNCECERQYLASFSADDLDGDAGYIAHDSIGTWIGNGLCSSAETNKLQFYLAIRDNARAARNCQQLRMAGVTTSGLYNIDPTSTGASVPVYCDMTSDGGGWTILHSATGADNEVPLVSDTVVAGLPLSNGAFNMSRLDKQNIGIVSSETMFRNGDTGSYLRASASAFDGNLVAGGHPHFPVRLTASDGTGAEGFMGYSTSGILSGGDFGVSMTDGPTCSGTMIQGFDHHNTTAYNHLNCGCARQYLYSYSSSVGDSDAGYDVNTGLGSWAGTTGCDGNEGGLLIFRTAVRGDVAASCGP